MIRSPELPNPDLCEEIGRLLHTTLTKVQRRHAHLLNESCRHWLRVAPPEAQIAKIITVLAQQADIPALLKAVDCILGKLFIPAFQGSSAHEQLLQRVQKLMTINAPQPNNCLAETAYPIEEGPVDDSLNSDLAGLVLVDAENLIPSESLENFLLTIGQYPIRHRLAFGNWHKLGGQDQALYQRGYQMMHVPSGKNSADIILSLQALSISRMNPSIREVFICSNDSDLLHLGHTLLDLGVVPYRVSRRNHGNCFDILNLEKHTTQSFQQSQAGKIEGAGDTVAVQQTIAGEPPSGKTTATDPAALKVPSPDEMVRWLKSLIRQ
jgi:hypothetical protein